MHSIEDHMKVAAVEEFYDNIDKDMWIGCGEPFKNEMSKLIDIFLGKIDKHFKLTYQSLINGKKVELQEIKKGIDLLVKKYRGDKVIIDLQNKIRELEI